jgi:hypothetical protein
MHLFFSLLTLAASVLTTSNQTVAGLRSHCGTAEISMKVALEREVATFAKLAKIASTSRRSDEPFSRQINVYFHEINENEKSFNGRLTDGQISKQIDVLNLGLSGSGISFKLASTDRTTNSDWFNSASIGTAEQTEMKKALRKGGEGDLNIYTVGFGDTGLLGYATFPEVYDSNPTDDGVVLLYSTLPGGNATPFNLGKTLTHEVGHWLGLYHTFQGGCSGDGDFVSDTPAEALPSDGSCSTTRDSCPGNSGLDPLSNYMNYSEDACMTDFTAGQIKRMQSQLIAYR